MKRFLIGQVFFLSFALVSTEGIGGDIQPSVMFPSNTYAGLGWPPTLTDGCYDRGECPIWGVEIVVIDVPEAPPTELVAALPVCNPNYAGACVPSVSLDVDCAGSGEDGPSFVGPVRIVGRDIFHLDVDGDGIACDP